MANTGKKKEAISPPFLLYQCYDYNALVICGSNGVTAER